MVSWGKNVAEGWRGRRSLTGGGTCQRGVWGAEQDIAGTAWGVAAGIARLEAGGGNTPHRLSRRGVGGWGLRASGYTLTHGTG